MASSGRRQAFPQSDKAENPYADLGEPCNLEPFFNMPFLNNTLDRVTPNERRYLIYTCRYGCGGLADQFKGVTSSYAIAKRSDRALRIHETVCGISTYLRPKNYDWTYDEREISSLSSTFCYNNYRKKTRDKQLNEYLLYLNESVIFLRSNLIYRERDEEYGRIFRDTFDELFDLKREIKMELNSFKDTYVQDNVTVCAHIRVGKHPGFTDNRFNNLGNISEIWKFLSQYDEKGHVIYIATDSIAVRESARRRYPDRFIDMPGPVINTAFDRDDESCSAFRKIILDFAFLTTCDVLLLTCSDLGFHASIIRNIEGNQYCFEGGRVYPCPFYSILRYRTPKDMRPLLDI